MIRLVGHRRLGKECGQGSIIMSVSVRVGLPNGEFHVIKLILGKELLIWGLVVLGRVCKILLVNIADLGEGLPGW